MNLLALDLSLTSTGWATGPLRYGTLTGSGFRGMRRLRWLRDAVLEIAAVDLPQPAHVVLIEGYGFTGGRGHAPMELGELGGVIRLALYEAGIPYVDIAPATLKKLATGRGNAAKDDVFAEAIRRLEYRGRSKDEADALWLWVAGALHYGVPNAPKLPQTHTEALRKVAWPSIEREAVA